MTVIPRDIEVIVPSSAEEAVQAFGDGTDTTVVAGGTIVMPDLASGNLRPRRVVLLTRAGLNGVSRDGGTVRIGATTSVAALADAPEPLATFSRYVADYEVRAQATIGGNLCAPPGGETPRGDLQAALLAMAARVRSAGAGGEQTQPVDEFLAGGNGRLVLALEVDEPQRASAVGLGRPHAHSYTTLAVACAETAEGVRVAAVGAGPRAVRLQGVEQALAGGADPASAAKEALSGVEPQDDALASAWYRKRMLPVLVERALTNL
jgi:aerobic carbon-monoxide dehydrogenase medium subunit